MTPDVLLYHLLELGVTVALGPGCRTLELTGAAEMLTPELTELLAAHKAELIECVYEIEERAAIQEIDGTPTLNVAARHVTLEGDPYIVDLHRHTPAVVMLADYLSKRGGGVLEFIEVAA
ncbi:MAG: hypothetical protein ACJ74W_01415 [Pyrinomonadaceae bacterium]